MVLELVKTLEPTKYSEKEGFLPKLISPFFMENRICRDIFLGWCHCTKLELEVWSVEKKWKKAEKMKR